jgi:hypothetical protein
MAHCVAANLRITKLEVTCVTNIRQEIDHIDIQVLVFDDDGQTKVNFNDLCNASDSHVQEKKVRTILSS